MHGCKSISKQCYTWIPVWSFDLQSIFTLTLGSIRVDRGTWQSLIEEIVIKKVGRLLVVDKDYGTRRRHRKEQVKQSLALLGLINEDDLSGSQLSPQ